MGRGSSRAGRDGERIGKQRGEVSVAVGVAVSCGDASVVNPFVADLRLL